MTVCDRESDASSATVQSWAGGRARPRCASLTPWCCDRAAARSGCEAAVVGRALRAGVDHPAKRPQTGKRRRPHDPRRPTSLASGTPPQSNMDLSRFPSAMLTLRSRVRVRAKTPYEAVDLRHRIPSTPVATRGPSGKAARRRGIASTAVSRRLPAVGWRERSNGGTEERAKRCPFRSSAGLAIRSRSGSLVREPLI